jgi:monomeric isocitrate dehydrogenase
MAKYLSKVEEKRIANRLSELEKLVKDKDAEILKLKDAADRVPEHAERTFIFMLHQIDDLHARIRELEKKEEE